MNRIECGTLAPMVPDDSGPYRLVISPCHVWHSSTRLRRSRPPLRGGIRLPRSRPFRGGASVACARTSARARQPVDSLLTGIAFKRHRAMAGSARRVGYLAQPATRQSPRAQQSGSVLQMLGRAAEAEKAYERAIETAPDLELPYLNLGKRHLVGVDLSEKMLVRARTRGVYDEPHLSEVYAWLSGATAAWFDAVIAADVFIYIGTLEELFREVARVCDPTAGLPSRPKNARSRTTLCYPRDGRHNLRLTSRVSRKRHRSSGHPCDTFVGTSRCFRAFGALCASV